MLVEHTSTSNFSLRELHVAATTVRSGDEGKEKIVSPRSRRGLDKLVRGLGSAFFFFVN